MHTHCLLLCNPIVKDTQNKEALIGEDICKTDNNNAVTRHKIGTRIVDKAQRDFILGKDPALWM